LAHFDANSQFYEFYDLFYGPQVNSTTISTARPLGED